MIFPKFIEKGLIFHPGKSNDTATPDIHGIEYDDVIFQTEDGLNLNGWFVPGKKLHPILTCIHSYGFTVMQATLTAGSIT